MDKYQIVEKLEELVKDMKVATDDAYGDSTRMSLSLKDFIHTYKRVMEIE